MTPANNTVAKDYAKKMMESVRKMLQTAYREAFSAAKGDDWFAQLKADDAAIAGGDDKKLVLKVINAPEEMDFQACIKLLVFRKEYRELLLAHYHLEQKAKVVGTLCNELLTYRNDYQAHEGDADDPAAHEQAMENMKYLAGLFSAVHDEAGNSYKDAVERRYYDYKSTQKTQFYAFADHFDTARYSEDKLTAGATYLQLQVGVKNHQRGFYSADLDGDKTKILNFIVNMGSEEPAAAAKKSGKKPLMAAAAVIAVLLIAALVFGITRGGKQTAAPEVTESTTSAEDYVPNGEDACKAYEEMVETVKNGDVETLLPSLAEDYDAWTEEAKNTYKETFDYYKKESVQYDKQKTVMTCQLDDNTFSLVDVIYSVDKANNHLNWNSCAVVVGYRDGEWKLVNPTEELMAEWKTLMEQAVDDGMQTALEQTGSQDLIDIYQNEKDSKARTDYNVPLFLNNTALYDDYVGVMTAAVIETDDEICSLIYLMNGTDETTTFGEYWDYYNDIDSEVTMIAPDTGWSEVYNNRLHLSINFNKTVPAHTGVFCVVRTSKDAFLEYYRSVADWPENWVFFFEPAEEE